MTPEPVADHADPFPTITGVGVAVESGTADEGVMPIENSLEGAVTETLDLLIHTRSRSSFATR